MAVDGSVRPYRSIRSNSLFPSLDVEGSAEAPSSYPTGPCPITVKVAVPGPASPIISTIADPRIPYTLESVMELRREARDAAAARGFWKTPFSIRRVMLPPVNCCTSATVRLLVGMRLCWYSCSEKSIQSFCFSRSMSKMFDLKGRHRAMRCSVRVLLKQRVPFRLSLPLLIVVQLRMVQLDVVLKILVQILTAEQIGMAGRGQYRIAEQAGRRRTGRARGTVKSSSKPIQPSHSSCSSGQCCCSLLPGGRRPPTTPPPPIVDSATVASCTPTGPVATGRAPFVMLQLLYILVPLVPLSLVPPLVPFIVVVAVGVIAVAMGTLCTLIVPMARLAMLLLEVVALMPPFIPLIAWYLQLPCRFRLDETDEARSSSSTARCSAD
uniref:Uncharacterized protein n=1 Tax=Anopheles coluzzii TaxID=1518534 RepID=A0A8W7PIW0_ANOCL